MTLLASLFAAALALAALCLLGLVLVTLVVALRVTRALPPRGGFVDLGSTRLHYVEKGEGPAIVMIHGLGGQTGNFEHSLLDRLSDSFRVVLVDRPGSGYSTRRPGEMESMPAQVAAIAALIDRLGLERPLVVGHSLGGGVALALALDHPRATSGLALLSPLTHMPDEVPKALAKLALRSALARRLVAWTIATPLGLRGGRRTLDMVFAPDAPPEDFGLKAGGLMALRPASFVAASADLVALEAELPRLMARYDELSVPVAILFGRGDTILDPALHGERMVAAHPATRLDLVEGGHMLLVSQPDLVADWIRDCARRFTREPATERPETATQRSATAGTFPSDLIERSAP